jgi:ssDNA-binding Zn-finger/Zn-ribbon topoisomerase 1
MVEWKDAYTEDQISRIAEAIWGNDIWEYDRAEVICPICGANALVLISRMGRAPWSFRVNCRGCFTRGSGKSASAPGRDLSPAELGKIAKETLHGQESRCPCCQAPLKVEDAGVCGAGSHFMINCLRCGSHGQTPWPPEDH